MLSTRAVALAMGKGVEDETDALTHDVVPAWHAHAHVLLWMTGVSGDSRGGAIGTGVRW
jgi:hypothetical protein